MGKVECVCHGLIITDEGGWGENEIYEREGIDNTLFAFLASDYESFALIKW